MFKIEKLTFVSKNNETYDYTFNSGVNFFVSGNNTGKTEFYKLLDFLFGHDMLLSEIDCYKKCVSEIRLELTYNGSNFIFVRTIDINKNFIFYADEGQDRTDILSKDEYRVRLNQIFTPDEKFLKELRDFAEEDIGYRQFTMFNFLDEKSQGKTQDFLSKCSSLEYSLRLNTILNFIFNKNLIEIKTKEQEIKNLQKQLDDLESKKSRINFVIDKINNNLKIIDPNYYYTGKNNEEINEIITQTKAMNLKISASKNKNLADLEVMYNSLSEQIKRYKNEIKDMKEIKNYDTNRVKLLTLLKELTVNKSDLEYLVTPIEMLLQDMNKGISFSNYIVKDETVKKLERQLEGIKVEIKQNDSRFEMYSLLDKERAVAVIEEYLNADIDFVDEEEISRIKSEISKLRKEIRTLQNSDDIFAIDNFSQYITDKYLSLKEISNFVKQDSEQNGFKIKYIKKGNVLQPVRTENEANKEVERNYYPGSMARHIVIQLCGYAAFLNKLLKANKYPIIPIFVIDHISKAFDEKNCKAVGEVIFSLLKDVGDENLQVFMFDSEISENLGIDNKYSRNLVTENKTGFCPFFHENSD